MGALTLKVLTRKVAASMHGMMTKEDHHATVFWI